MGRGTPGRGGVGVGLAQLGLRWGRGAPAAILSELTAVAARRAGACGGGRARQVRAIGLVRRTTEPKRHAGEARRGTRGDQDDGNDP